MVNVYELVTNKIIEELEKGQIPWLKPWTGSNKRAFNRITKKPYSLINQMLLKHDGEYATFQQWHTLGGRIKKGAKSEYVVFWKMLEIEEENEDGEKVKRTIPMLKYYNVFHISCVDGVEPLQTEELHDIDSIEEAEKLATNYFNRENIKFIQELSNEAYYSPTLDLIHLPLKEQFTDSAEYYSTLFHEITHSTGAKNRLDRLDSTASYGKNENYSKEELVAELGSAFILNILGIETPKTFKNSSAYIQSWLKVLRNDNRFIISASTKAQKAVDFIMGLE